MKNLLTTTLGQNFWEPFKKKNITFAAVESFTGGAFAAEITKIPGASKYFKGSLISYDNSIKEKLGVDISKGVINFDAAEQMALKGKEYFGVDYCVSFTGNAGPGKMDNKPVGLVYISINSTTYKFNFKKYGTRENIIEKAVEMAIMFLVEKINKS